MTHHIAQEIALLEALRAHFLEKVSTHRSVSSRGLGGDSGRRSTGVGHKRSSALSAEASADSCTAPP